ncbi:MAG: hypothetical protein M9921_04030 [Fimbriimonadaceae bacterium]|nr:hypothetical protein [Chthonomonadaceae bacterium]MCO5296004.1 hypothetical protein [Fimbriimonadaceae bacterium]
MKLLRLCLAFVVCAFAFGIVGCSSGSQSEEASSAVQEIQKSNPQGGPKISQEDASGDASMMAGPKKGGG